MQRYRCWSINGKHIDYFTKLRLKFHGFVPVEFIINSQKNLIHLLRNSLISRSGFNKVHLTHNDLNIHIQYQKRKKGIS